MVLITKGNKIVTYDEMKREIETKSVSLDDAFLKIAKEIRRQKIERERIFARIVPHSKGKRVR